MKKLLLLVLAATMFVACGEKASYSINGKIAIDGADGKTVVLKKNENNEAVVIDSVKIADGKFTFTGNVIEPEAYSCEILDLEGTRPFIIFVENAKIDVLVEPDGATISGTELNDIASTFNTKRRALSAKRNELFKRYNDAKEAGTYTDEFEKEIMAEDSVLDEQQKTVYADLVKNNINNIVGHLYLPAATYGLEPQEIEALLESATPATLENEAVKNVVENLEILKKVAIGQPFVDFEMPDADGKNVKLSDYVGKGKYVLIDFWASWCGPCRDEMPVLVEMYKKYKNKKFEIVGVSLDKDKDKWVDAIKVMDMTWPQMSDLKVWASEGGKLYGVRGIPHAVLVDPQGIIIAKDLRGDKLKTKLAELLD